MMHYFYYRFTREKPKAHLICKCKMPKSLDCIGLAAAHLNKLCGFMFILCTKLNQKQTITRGVPWETDDVCVPGENSCDGSPVGPIVEQLRRTWCKVCGSHNGCCSGREWGRKSCPGFVCAPLRTVTQEAEPKRADVLCFQPLEHFLINRIISGGKASSVGCGLISEPTQCDNWLLNLVCNGAEGGEPALSVCGHECVFQRQNDCHHHSKSNSKHVWHHFVRVLCCTFSRSALLSFIAKWAKRTWDWRVCATVKVWRIWEHDGWMNEWMDLKIPGPSLTWGKKKQLPKNVHFQIKVVRQALQ